jgi:hypothetical protein
MARLFVRRRDGRIEVKLNEAGRAIAREAFGRVYVAEHDNDHEWHKTLNGPINPSVDADDPLLILARQSATGSNAELAIATLHDEFLTEQEAWAWLTTLQVALRATAVTNDIYDETQLEAADETLVDTIRTLQMFLFGLAEVL